MNKIDFYTLAKWRSVFKEWDFAENKSILFNLGFNFLKIGIGIRLEYGKHYLWKKSKWKVLAFTARFLIFKLQVGYSFNKKEEKK